MTDTFVPSVDRMATAHAEPGREPGRPGPPLHPLSHAHPSTQLDGAGFPLLPVPDSADPLDVLVWDAPNIDATLAQVIDAKPSASNRPRYDAIAAWFVQTAQGRDVEGAVFANIPPGFAMQMRGWVEAVRSFGFAVFAKPKLADGDDIDDAMLAHITSRAATGRLRRVVVASGDGRNFLSPLQELARSGVEIVVLSFFEVAGYAQESDLIRFIDLEEVPGAFLAPLDRVRLDSLPPEGAWLRPTKGLREVAASA